MSHDAAKLARRFARLYCERFAHIGQIRKVIIITDQSQHIYPIHRLAVSRNKPKKKPKKVFVLAAFQKGILQALEGRALRVQALGEAVKSVRRLYNDPGGLKELVREGLVQYHPRIGYFRPDMPPPDLK